MRFLVTTDPEGVECPVIDADTHDEAVRKVLRGRNRPVTLYVRTVGEMGWHVADCSRWPDGWVVRFGDDLRPVTKPSRDDALVELDRLRSENKRLLEREAFIARALNVADGGRYRNDFPGAVRSMKRNVRDACMTACAEVVARYEQDAFGHGSLEKAMGAQACLDALAELDVDDL